METKTKTAQPTYHVWTMGCQMNKADSEQLSGGLEQLGLRAAPDYSAADFLVINTCVVRQQAYDTAAGMISKTRALKARDADKFIAVMGCMVGPVQTELRRVFPHVDLWARPQHFSAIIEDIAVRTGADPGGCLSNLTPITPNVTAYISAVHGCDKFCAFCIIPYRRGRETSRSIEDLTREIRAIAERGVKDVTLLGQNVDSYGQDLRPRRDLADLLGAINEIPRIERIRFLTSHPNDMSRKIVEATRDIPKVCENINLPFQAGANRVLADMRRGYTREQYLERIAMIKDILPDATLTTDVIVGFPNESEAEFERSLDILERVRFHKVHSYTFSMRPQSYASRKMTDNVPRADKKRRLATMNELQKGIQTADNARHVGATFQILIDAHSDGRASGRTRGDKLVYIDDPRRELRVGELLDVKIAASSPWSLIGAHPALRDATNL